MAVSYRRKRKQTWFDNLASWSRLLELFRNEQIFLHGILPESGVSSRLYTALESLYAEDRESGKLILEEAVSHAEKLLTAGCCRSNKIVEGAYPSNLAIILRGRTYAKWLLGEGMDRATLREAAEHLVTWCLTKASDCKRISDSMTMAFYLFGVRLAMIAADTTYAKELLGAKHRFRWHHAIEGDLWTRMLENHPALDRAMRSELEAFFDRVRDPDFEERHDDTLRTFVSRDILALETGIIRQMYWVNRSSSDPVDPKAVVRAIAR